MALARHSPTNSNNISKPLKAMKAKAVQESADSSNYKVTFVNADGSRTTRVLNGSIQQSWQTSLQPNHSIVGFHGTAISEQGKATDHHGNIAKTMLGGELMAYFDNAATTYPKPEIVYQSMDQFQRHTGGNFGQGNMDFQVPQRA